MNNFFLSLTVMSIVLSSPNNESGKSTRELNGMFFFTISCNGKDILKTSGSGAVAEKNAGNVGLKILLTGYDDDNRNTGMFIAISIAGRDSGGYKFISVSSNKAKNGEAVFVVFPGTTPELKEIKNTLLLSQGILHLSVNGTCMGSFEGTGTNNGEKYEVKGGFQNIPFKMPPEK